MYTYERRTGEVGACCCWRWDVSGMFVQDNNASFTVEQCLSALHDLTYYRLDWSLLLKQVMYHLQ